jgi:hypothetical protein
MVAVRMRVAPEPQEITYGQFHATPQRPVDECFERIDFPIDKGSRLKPYFLSIKAAAGPPLSQNVEQTKSGISTTGIDKEFLSPCPSG